MSPLVVRRPVGGASLSRKELRVGPGPRRRLPWPASSAGVFSGLPSPYPDQGGHLQNTALGAAGIALDELGDAIPTGSLERKGSVSLVGAQAV